MTALALTLTLPLHHVKCRHRLYSMTCDEFDELHGDGRCQICGVDEMWVQNRYGCLLYIDHWGGGPTWHVRGLLCVRCNTRLKDGRGFNNAARHYLANSYWRSVLTARIPDTEPASKVAHFRWRRRWYRNDDGWWPDTFKAVDDGPLTWQQLCHRHGPPTLPGSWRHAATSAPDD